MHTNVIVALAGKGVVPVVYMKTNQLLLVTWTEKLRRGCTFAHILCARNVQCKLNLRSYDRAS
jgi:hypothetical protein